MGQKENENQYRNQKKDIEPFAKWMALSFVVGAAVGVAVNVFVTALNYSVSLLSTFNYFLLLPLGGLAGGLIALKLLPKGTTQIGTNLALKKIKENHGIISS